MKPATFPPMPCMAADSEGERGAAADSQIRGGVEVCPEDLEQEVSALFVQHFASLSGYARALSPSSSDAQDAVQEAFVRYHSMRAIGGNIDNPRAWLFRVARNFLADVRRTPEATRTTSIEAAATVADSSARPDSFLARADIARKIEADLSPRENECVRLRAEGMRYDEIAEVMGIRRGTVSALLARAVGKLRKSCGTNGGRKHR